jgi:hypothetical protein
MTWLQQKHNQQKRKGFFTAAVSLWADFKRSLVARLKNTLIKNTRTASAELNSHLEADLRSQGRWGGADGDRHACESNYWAMSTAPAETLWQLVTNLADLSSWHPLITATNAPHGQRATPGLIYRAVMPYLPISTQIFVERVLPGELLSIRLFPLPGLQERVTYRIVSTLCGTCVLYSITLSGWLSPLAWPVVKPHTTKVAAALVEAAEQHMLGISKKKGKTDIFGAPR